MSIIGEYLILGEDATSSGTSIAGSFHSSEIMSANVIALSNCMAVLNSSLDS